VDGAVKATIWLMESDAASADQIRACLYEAKFHITTLNPETLRHEATERPLPHAILFAEDTASLTVADLRQLLDLDGQACFLILLAANPPIERVVDAAIEGAHAYLTKPVNGHRLRRVLERGLEHQSTYQQIMELATQVHEYTRQLQESRLSLIREKRELEERTRHLRFLHELGLAINASLNRTQIVKEVFTRLKGEMEVPWCRARLFAENNGLSDWEHAVGNPGKSSVVSLPLTVRGKCIGFLDVAVKDPKRREGQDLLKTASLQVGMALQNATHHNLVKRLADHDHLTRLDNRRSFERHLSREFQRYLRYDEHLSLMFCDLDNFKALNDRLGHQTGDSVLKQIARLMLNGFRGCDYVARWGGDEFAVILPKTTKEQALLSAERFHRNLEKHLMKSGLAVEVGVSIGIADTKSVPVRNKEDLIALADEALFQAKKQGRNRIQLCPGGQASVSAASGQWPKPCSRAVA
jgi:diguanylate cyclase (GGDEF)-like protein